MKEQCEVFCSRIWCIVQPRNRTHNLVTVSATPYSLGYMPSLMYVCACMHACTHTHSCVHDILLFCQHNHVGRHRNAMTILTLRFKDSVTTISLLSCKWSLSSFLSLSISLCIYYVYSSIMQISKYRSDGGGDRGCIIFDMALFSSKHSSFKHGLQTLSHTIYLYYYFMPVQLPLLHTPVNGGNTQKSFDILEIRGKYLKLIYNPRKIFFKLEEHFDLTYVINW